MVATAAELLADVRQHLDETAAQFWTDDVLYYWMYEALRDVARRTECLEDVKRYTIVGGQQQYDLPTDMLRINRVVYRQTTGYTYSLQLSTLQNLDDVWGTAQEIAGSQPYWCAVWGTPGMGTQQLYLYPTPSTTLDDGLRVFYYRLPKKPGSTHPGDPVDIPSGWEDLVPLYVEIVARRKEARDSRWKEAQALYEARLEAMVETTRQWHDQMNFLGRETSGYPIWLTQGGEPW